MGNSLKNNELQRNSCGENSKTRISNFEKLQQENWEKDLLTYQLKIYEEFIAQRWLPEDQPWVCGQAHVTSKFISLVKEKGKLLVSDGLKSNLFITKCAIKRHKEMLKEFK